jgi:hypothetical protein
MKRGMRRVALIFVTLTCAVVATLAQIAQTMPNELYGRWEIRRILPARTISCWNYKEARTIIGTEIEYSQISFRWKGIFVKNPKAIVRIVSAEQYHNENSGGSSNSSQVTFQQLGIIAKQTTLITLEHSPAEVTGATTEIPGDEVLIKDRNTIVFSVCSVYFEAERVSGASSPKSKSEK